MTTTEPGHTGAKGGADRPSDGAWHMVDMDAGELLRDPFGGYSRIREQSPVVRGVMPGVAPVWLVTRYDDVKTVLSDPRFVNNPENVPGMHVENLGEQILRGTHGTPPEYMKYRMPQMGSFDGQAHARLRGLVSRVFTVRRVARLRPRVEEIAEQLLDRLPAAATHKGGADGGGADGGGADGGGAAHSPDGASGVVDLLAHFAYPLSSTVLCELVGIPECDRTRWHELYKAIWLVTEQDKTEGWREMVAYSRGLIERRRAEPADDLLSGMIHAVSESGDRLTETELITMIMTLSLAGRQTTADLIGNGIVALLSHPEQLARLRAEPDLLPRAVHELLRYCTPTLAVRVRYATEDVEIGGVLVRKGEALRPLLVAANYDPRRFDEPERFDITRDPGGRRETHVSFSYGAHYCLGAALARLEGEVAFGALLRRFSDLTLAADPQDLEYVMVPGQWHLLKTLPVRLEPVP